VLEDREILLLLSYVQHQTGTLVKEERKSEQLPQKLDVQA
jgi:hypothetical protein